MKKLPYALLLLLIHSISFSQDIKIIGVSDNGEKDSITVGFRATATMGIDAHLGEINIFNTPVKNVDMRVVQRDSLNYSCTHTIKDTTRFRFYFPIVFDSKVNYRSSQDTTFINRMFEVKFMKPNINTIYIIPSHPHGSPILDSLRFLTDSCENNWSVVEIRWGPNSVPPLPFRAANFFTNIVLIFKKNFVLQNKESNNSELIVYPNPFSNTLVVKNELKSQNETIKLFDLMGKEVFRQKCQTDLNEFNLQHLQTGIYTIVLYDDLNRIVNSKRVFKL